MVSIFLRVCSITSTVVVVDAFASFRFDEIRSRRQLNKMQPIIARKAVDAVKQAFVGIFALAEDLFDLVERISTDGRAAPNFDNRLDDGVRSGRITVPIRLASDGAVVEQFLNVFAGAVGCHQFAVPDDVFTIDGNVVIGAQIGNQHSRHLDLLACRMSLLEVTGEMNADRMRVLAVSVGADSPLGTPALDVAVFAYK